MSSFCPPYRSFFFFIDDNNKLTKLIENIRNTKGYTLTGLRLFILWTFELRSYKEIDSTFVAVKVAERLKV